MGADTQRKTYLGDGVYLAFDRWGGLVLTTEDGTGHPTNTIYLEQEVYDALTRAVGVELARAAP